MKQCDPHLTDRIFQDLNTASHIYWPPTSGGIYGNLRQEPPQGIPGLLVDFLHGVTLVQKKLFWFTLVDWLNFWLTG